MWRAGQGCQKGGGGSSEGGNPGGTRSQVSQAEHVLFLVDVVGILRIVFYVFCFFFSEGWQLQTFFVHTFRCLACSWLGLRACCCRFIHV